jgi:very-short-patch-repair endonuclease
VSTFTGEELDKARAKGGVAFLRDYLIYAGSGATWMGDTLTPPPELNAFERSVLAALTGAGLDVVPQLGVGKYRIDFAIRHRSDPCRFALAVECDGASYHSQPTARERDRLRQEALEARGWNFYRIWSTNWFNNPEHELEQLLVEYERVLTA